MRRRKQKDIQEIQHDPDFLFYVGRLVGAAEISSYWLQLQQESQAQELGKRLGMVTGWFLTEGQDDKEITAILPPQKT